MADAAVTRVVLNYDDAVRAVRARVLSFIRRTWGGLEQFRDADIDRWVARVVPAVAGGQRQVAALTDGYLAAIEASALGIPVRPRGIPTDLITTDAMRGVPAESVYRRPAVTVWMALASGAAIDAAAGLGLTRALAIGATDLQLARTHAARYTFAANDKIVGYRRVPGGGNVCDLCASAATMQYRVEDLMPIHNGCSCGVEPIYGTADPGAIDTSFDNPEADVVVQDHGELGPVLALADQAFKGPDDLEG